LICCSFELLSKFSVAVSRCCFHKFRHERKPALGHEHKRPRVAESPPVSSLHKMDAWNCALHSMGTMVGQPPHFPTITALRLPVGSVSDKSNFSAHRARTYECRSLRFPGTFDDANRRSECRLDSLLAGGALRSFLRLFMASFEGRAGMVYHRSLAI